MVCGPSGVGKGTLLKKLFAEYPDKFGFSISRTTLRPQHFRSAPSLLRLTTPAWRWRTARACTDTTRAPRAGETHGKEYWFATREQMLADRDAGKFIETAEFSGNMYGTSIEAVKSVADQGKICVLEIDVQGAVSVSKTDLHARFAFIKPPSWEILETRLKGRGTESAEAIDKRLQTARKELDFLESSKLFECVIVNDDIDTAYAELKKFILDA